MLAHTSENFCNYELGQDGWWDCCTYYVYTESHLYPDVEEDYWRLELKIGESAGEGVCKPAEDRYYLACVLDGDKPFFEDGLVIFRHNGNGRLVS